jgi:hypothetical protein
MISAASLYIAMPKQHICLLILLSYLLVYNITTTNKWFVGKKLMNRFQKRLNPTLLQAAPPTKDTDLVVSAVQMRRASLLPAK